MGFAINPSLTHLDIAEQYILEMYRSKSEILLADARFRGHPCEAYICIANIEQKVKAYVALLETGLKSIFVYTSDLSTDSGSEYSKILAEAEDFTKSLGFSLERVNLEFSPAMREVIIKGLRVMRPPQKKASLRSYLSPTQAHIELVTPAAQPAGKDASAGESQSTEIKSLQTQLASAKAVIEKITREKLQIEQSATREVATLKAAAIKATEAKQELEERFSSKLKALKTDAENSENAARAAAVNAAIDQTLSTARLSEQSLKAEIASLRAKMETGASDRLQLENELTIARSSAAEKLARIQSANDSLTALLAAEKAAAADKTASLTQFETSWRESQLREEDLCRNLDILSEQINLLENELAKYRENSGNEELIQQKITSLEKELAAVKSENERLSSGAVDRAKLENTLKGITEAKNDVEAEYIRLANEKMEKEGEMIDALYEAEAEIFRLSRELEIHSQVAEMETAALKDELRQLIIAGAVPSPQSAAKPSPAAAMAAAAPAGVAPAAAAAVPPVPAVPSPPAAAAITPPAPPQTHVPADLPAEPTDDDTPDTPIPGDPEITNGLLNEFGTFCGSSNQAAVDFTLDPAMTGIEYADPAEIVAIISSVNTLQAVPDGSKPQKCRGYAIATKKQNRYMVYVVWHLTESNKVVICTPDQQPGSAAECTQILSDAISYFEIVGFMMEIEELGGSVSSHNRVIKKVPVFHKH